jgi:outer membrane protein assembly factor BamA
MRGYYTRRLSPMVALQDGGYSPVGGTAAFDAGIEVRFTVLGNVGGVLFLDAGNSFLTSDDLWKLDRLQWAPGLGIRYRSPVGPIRLDLGGRLPMRANGQWTVPTVPVMEIRPDGSLVDTGTTHSEPILCFHLSIGEAF